MSIYAQTRVQHKSIQETQELVQETLRQMSLKSHRCQHAALKLWQASKVKLIFIRMLCTCMLCWLSYKLCVPYTFRREERCENKGSEYNLWLTDLIMI